jgi:hypothetical protein
MKSHINVDGQLLQTNKKWSQLNESQKTWIYETARIEYEKYIDEKGGFDISKCNLVAYSNGGYYSLGEKIGKFGYSVEKINK